MAPEVLIGLLPAPCLLAFQERLKLRHLMCLPRTTGLLGDLIALLEALGEAETTLLARELRRRWKAEAATIPEGLVRLSAGLGRRHESQRRRRVLLRRAAPAGIRRSPW